MTNELIAGYANYASTEAILHEQQNAALQDIPVPSLTYSITINPYTVVTATISL
ncbi:hypothetical protein ACQP1K_10355 [Sphaerimonospora sp. CA-214678]|uniref:hypothetical protein n=1 Tax=Sphaerimonospora sp. CA-214678 TaxID=3240029 RepID=UPI003D8E0F1F